MFAQDRLSDVRSARAPCLRMQWLMAVLIMLASSWPVFSAADDAGEFLVEDAHAWSDAGLQMLDARFSTRLSSGAREALENELRTAAGLPPLGSSADGSDDAQEPDQRPSESAEAKV